MAPMTPPSDNRPNGAEGLPAPLTPEEFSRIGHRLVDDIASLLGSMGERPLTSAETATEVRVHLDSAAPLPREGSDPAELMARTTELLFDHSLYNGHPRFFGYITSGAWPLGVLGDLLASAVNPNVGAWVLSPMASEMEAQAVRWLAEMIGYPSGGDGILTSGGNMANLLAFWAARAAKTDWNIRTEGNRAADARPLVAYGAEGTHTWIQKAFDLSGLGTDAIRWIASDAQGRMRTDALRERIEADLAGGAVPFMVVGNAGSVGTGAVDPLPILREICDEHDIWLHADGAYGAFAACLPDASDDLRGLSLADSVALDPHKWMYVPLEAGCTLVRDPQALLRAFSYRPPYYAFDEDLSNYYDRGIQNSRGFRALKVWLALKHLGLEGYERLIAKDIHLAERLFEMAGEHPDLEALTRSLSITTFRYVPRDLRRRVGDPEVCAYLDTLADEMLARIERSGDAFVSRAIVRGAVVLRSCIVNFRTQASDLIRLIELVVAVGAACDAEIRPATLGREP